MKLDCGVSEWKQGAITEQFEIFRINTSSDFSAKLSVAENSAGMLWLQTDAFSHVVKNYDKNSAGSE